MCYSNGLQNHSKTLVVLFRAHGDDAVCCAVMLVETPPFPVRRSFVYRVCI